MNLQPVTQQYDDVYHANLLAAFLARDGELINHTFELPPGLATDRCVNNPVRAFRCKFSELMAQWLLEGGVGVTAAMIEHNPNAAKFGTVLDHDQYGYHVTAYGPRVKVQLQFVLNELRRNPESRRACIMMLASSDQLVAEAMAANATNCEYLCTYAFNFRVRQGSLDLNVSMRSNNYTTTVCQDVYVFSRLQEHVANQLGIPVGRYYHHAASAHVLPGERERAAQILMTYHDAIEHTQGLAAWSPEWDRAWTTFNTVCRMEGWEF